MQLRAGEISLCLNVTDVHTALAFYEGLGFAQTGGVISQGWVLLKYGAFELGLYQGHIDTNTLNFRGANPFLLAPQLLARGITPDGDPHDEADGSQSLWLTDPDGNRVYINSFDDEQEDYARLLAQPRALGEAIIYVRDMAAQVAFYRDVLGLRMTYPTAVSEYACEQWVTFDTGECTLALHGGGQGRLGEDAPKLVFMVRDLDLARAQMLSRGVEMGEVRSPAPGVLVSDAADPEGNRFSLEQR